jgi:cell division protein FtsB
MTYKEFLSSKTVITLLVIFLLFLSYLKWQQYKGQREVDAEKQNLMQQAQNLEKKNNDLSQSLSYLNTPAFKERLAREQLNLKKDGEVVYNFAEKQSEETLPVAQDSQNSGSNFKKWINYFVGD